MLAGGPVFDGAGRHLRSVVLLATMVGTQARAQDPPPDLVLWNVTVIDGRGGPARPAQAITIRGDRIVSVTPADGTPPRAGAERLDLSSHWVMPGLIDTHVHLPPNRDSLRLRLERLFRAGVTSVRDLAGDARLYAELALIEGSAARPRARVFYSAFFAGPSWFAADPRPRGATGDRPPGAVPWFLAVTDTTDIAAAVADAKRLGVTGIKLYSDLSLAVIQRVVQAAHDHGLQVWSHPAVFPVRPSDVVRAGVNVISHAALLVWEAVDSLPSRFHTDPWTNFGPIGPYDAVAPDTAPVRRLLALMKERGTILDATVSTISTGIAPVAARWACAVTRGAHRTGVAVSTGTDRRLTTHPDGRPAVLDEMTMLVDQCGFTTAEAIVAATATASRTVGWGDRLGTIEPNRVADLLILAADPLADLDHLRRVAYVVKDGRVHVADALTR